MTAPLHARRPDALDLAETLAIAASDLRATAIFISVTGRYTAEELSEARSAAYRAADIAYLVLAALDAYEAES